VARLVKPIVGPFFEPESRGYTSEDPVVWAILSDPNLRGIQPDTIKMWIDYATDNDGYVLEGVVNVLPVFWLDDSYGTPGVFDYGVDDLILDANQNGILDTGDTVVYAGQSKVVDAAIGAQLNMLVGARAGYGGNGVIMIEPFSQASFVDLRLTYYRFSAMPAGEHKIRIAYQNFDDVVHIDVDTFAVDNTAPTFFFRDGEINGSQLVSIAGADNSGILGVNFDIIDGEAGPDLETLKVDIYKFQNEENCAECGEPDSEDEQGNIINYVEKTLLVTATSAALEITGPFSEDDNQNGVLDSGEDRNRNGVLDTDPIFWNVNYPINQLFEDKEELQIVVYNQKDLAALEDAHNEQDIFYMDPLTGNITFLVGWLLGIADNSDYFQDSPVDPFEEYYVSGISDGVGNTTDYAVRGYVVFSPPTDTASPSIEVPEDITFAIGQDVVLSIPISDANGVAVKSADAGDTEVDLITLEIDGVPVGLTMANIVTDGLRVAETNLDLNGNGKIDDMYVADSLVLKYTVPADDAAAALGPHTYTLSVSDSAGNSVPFTSTYSIEGANFVMVEPLNFPNPVTEATLIKLDANQRINRVAVKIYDFAGDLVWKTKLEGDAANAPILWAAQNYKGKKVADGVYFAYVDATSHTGAVDTAVIKIAVTKK
jgi:hypothetical protein